jgi:hypothetical protein
MAKHLYQSGNQYGKLAKGIPKPTRRKTFTIIVDEILEAISTDEVLENMRKLDPFQFNMVHTKLVEMKKDREEKRIKYSIEKERLQGGELPTSTIDIRLLDEGSDDSVIE